MADSTSAVQPGFQPWPHSSPAARTPGTLGWWGHADPSHSALLGDTPGPLGWMDLADPTLPLFSPWHLPLPGGLCRIDGGPPLALGTSALLPAGGGTHGEISIADAQGLALRITTVFEGGKSMNYQALADDFDGQATSFGLIQWNFGQGTLGPLLKKMLTKDATAFAACFGTGADYGTLKKALDSNKSADQAQWARDLLATSAGKKAWRAAFEAIGSVDAFNAIQREEAAAKYHPSVVSCIEKLRGLVPEVMQDVAFRSYAALFDLCVQQNNLTKAWDEIKAEVDNQKPTTQAALLLIAVTQRAKKASSAWVSDCLSRRLGILEGSAVESTEHKVTKKRENSQYGLLAEHGNKKVQGL